MSNPVGRPPRRGKDGKDNKVEKDLKENSAEKKKNLKQSNLEGLLKKVSFSADVDMERDKERDKEREEAREFKIFIKEELKRINLEKVELEKWKLESLEKEISFKEKLEKLERRLEKLEEDAKERDGKVEKFIELWGEPTDGGGSVWSVNDNELFFLPRLAWGYRRETHVLPSWCLLSLYLVFNLFKIVLLIIRLYNIK